VRTKKTGGTGYKHTHQSNIPSNELSK